jgi:hypothetical protein
MASGGINSLSREEGLIKMGTLPVPEIGYV